MTKMIISNCVLSRLSAAKVIIWSVYIIIFFVILRNLLQPADPVPGPGPGDVWGLKLSLPASQQLTLNGKYEPHQSAGENLTWDSHLNLQTEYLTLLGGETKRSSNFIFAETIFCIPITWRWIFLLRELCLGPETWHSNWPLSLSFTSLMTITNSVQAPLTTAL